MASSTAGEARPGLLLVLLLPAPAPEAAAAAAGGGGTAGEDVAAVVSMADGPKGVGAGGCACAGYPAAGGGGACCCC